MDGTKLMVPLRPIAEQLGLKVDWDREGRTVLLFTEESYRDELDPVEEWEEWMGEKPLDKDNPTGKEITDEELKDYISENSLPVEDYHIVSRYSAVVLEVRENESSVYVLERLRNGGLGWDSGINTYADEEGFSVHQTVSGFVRAVVYESAQKHEIEYCVAVSYDHGQKTEQKLFFDGRKGLLIPVPGDRPAGTVTFYGKDGYLHEARFW